MKSMTDCKVASDHFVAVVDPKCLSERLRLNLRSLLEDIRTETERGILADGKHSLTETRRALGANEGAKALFNPKLYESRLAAFELWLLKFGILAVPESKLRHVKSSNSSTDSSKEAVRNINDDDGCRRLSETVDGMRKMKVIVLSKCNMLRKYLAGFNQHKTRSAQLLRKVIEKQKCLHSLQTELRLKNYKNQFEPVELFIDSLSIAMTDLQKSGIVQRGDALYRDILDASRTLSQRMTPSTTLRRRFMRLVDPDGLFTVQADETLVDKEEELLKRSSTGPATDKTEFGSVGDENVMKVDPCEGLREKKGPATRGVCILKEKGSCYQDVNDEECFGGGGDIYADTNSIGHDGGGGDIDGGERDLVLVSSSDFITEEFSGEDGVSSANTNVSVDRVSVLDEFGSVVSPGRSFLDDGDESWLLKRRQMSGSSVPPLKELKHQHQCHHHRDSHLHLDGHEKCQSIEIVTETSAPIADISDGNSYLSTRNPTHVRKTNADFLNQVGEACGDANDDDGGRYYLKEEAPTVDTCISKQSLFDADWIDTFLQ